MLENKSSEVEYVVKVVAQSNPLEVVLPIMPTTSDYEKTKVLTIDCASFQVVQTGVNVPTNVINPKTDIVKLMFSNGFGCFDENGEQGRVLELLEPTIEWQKAANWVKKWQLVGSADPYIWTSGHDLELGFADVNDNPINFNVTGLNTYYIICLEVLIV